MFFLAETETSHHMVEVSVFECSLPLTFAMYVKDMSLWEQHALLRILSFAICVH